MPSSAAHRASAQQNEELVKFLGGAKTTQWAPWVTTAAFYAAVHWVDSFLVLNKTPALDHKIRNDTLLQWVNIRAPYMRLYQMSRDARYNCRVHTEMELNGVLILLKQVKDEVKAEVTKLVQAQQQQQQRVQSPDG